MENAESIKIAQDTLTEGCEVLGLSIYNPKVLDIKGARWTLGYDGVPGREDFSRSMIKLELWLRGYLNIEVDLMLEAIEDKNKRDIRTGRQPQALVSARNVESLEP